MFLLGGDHISDVQGYEVQPGPDTTSRHMSSGRPVRGLAQLASTLVSVGEQLSHARRAPLFAGGGGPSNLGGLIQGQGPRAGFSDTECLPRYRTELREGTLLGGQTCKSSWAAGGGGVRYQFRSFGLTFFFLPQVGKRWLTLGSAEVTCALWAICLPRHLHGIPSSLVSAASRSIPESPVAKVGRYQVVSYPCLGSPAAATRSTLVTWHLALGIGAHQVPAYLHGIYFQAARHDRHRYLGLQFGTPPERHPLTRPRHARMVTGHW